MTGNAGRFEWFVCGPSISSVGVWTVTFTAGDIAMCAIKNESTVGMIKGRGFPSFGGMTLRTLRGAINGKLRFMDIGVTGLAVRADPSELNQSSITSIRHVRVALVAGDLYMHPFEREVALRVVIVDLVESVNVMAKFASIGGNQFVDLPAMWILVAGHTACGVERESKFRAVIGGLALVTGEAGDCLVRATERIFGLLMLDHQETCRRKGLHGMALLAISLGGALGELTIVEV